MRSESEIWLEGNGIKLLQCHKTISDEGRQKNKVNKDPSLYTYIPPFTVIKLWVPPFSLDFEFCGASLQLRSQRRLTTSGQRKEMSVVSGQGTHCRSTVPKAGADQRRFRPRRVGNTQGYGSRDERGERREWTGNMAADPNQRGSCHVQRLEEDWARSAASEK